MDDKNSSASRGNGDRHRMGSTFDALSLLQQASNAQESIASNDASASGASNMAAALSFSNGASMGSSSSLGNSAAVQQQMSQDRQNANGTLQMSNATFNTSNNNAASAASNANSSIDENAQNQLLSMALSSGLLGNLANQNNAAATSNQGINQHLQTFLLQQLATMRQAQQAPQQAPQQADVPGPAIDETPTATLGTTQQDTPAQPQTEPKVKSSSDDVVTKPPSPRSISSTSVVVPCRARGLSMEHNFQTASFVIPENVKHGEGLICSFPACQRRGIRFLYCAYCKDAVAKRNFRNKHSHIDDSDDTETAATHERQSLHYPAETPQVSASEQQEPATTNKRKRPEAFTTAYSISVGTSSSGVSSKSSDESQKRPARARVQDSQRESGTDDERRELWAALLDKRPRMQDGDGMSAWLMQVMAISNVKKPLQEVTTLIESSDFSSSSPLDTSDTSSDENNKKEAAMLTRSVDHNTRAG